MGRIEIAEVRSKKQARRLVEYLISRIRPLFIDYLNEDTWIIDGKRLKIEKINKFRYKIVEES